MGFPNRGSLSSPKCKQEIYGQALTLLQFATFPYPYTCNSTDYYARVRTMRKGATVSHWNDTTDDALLNAIFWDARFVDMDSQRERLEIHT